MPADAVIAIQVGRIAQIFDSFDPYPFRERDLDPDAEAYIVDYARELPHAAPIRIVVHLPPREAESAEARHLPDAMRHYFGYRADTKRKELRDLLNLGRRALAIGLMVLAVCTLAAEFVTHMLPEGPGVLREGLLILGWVANWRPLEIFLYDWWPIARQGTLYRRLASATVEVRSDEPATVAGG